ncbi:MAG TPA: response regulator transcription factor, partial [archaeon]|nr:response regulator transcription factor [archaeon]
NKNMAPNPYVISVLSDSADVLNGLIKNADSSSEADISEILEKLKSTAKIAKKPRVIVADDQNFFRTMIKKMLISMDCEVVGEATNGDEAVELFLKEAPDLLLLDIHMPGKNGDKALEEIIESSPDARVIILTSIGDSAIVAKCLKLGALNYILKGTTRENMKIMIERSLRKILE